MTFQKLNIEKKFSTFELSTAVTQRLTFYEKNERFKE